MEVSRGKPIWAFGVMTGTSMDGVDLALLKTDGETISSFGPTHSCGISPTYQRLLSQAMKQVENVPTSDLRDPALWPNWLHEAEQCVRQFTDFAVESFLFKNGIYLNGPTDEPWISINENWEQTCSGVHGQTIAHRPQEAFTLQIGSRLLTHSVDLGSIDVTKTTTYSDPNAMAGSFFNPLCTEVWDFRTADMEAGGEGAPLAPFFHFALAKRIGATEPVAFLNIGGVANVTWVDPAKNAPEEEGALLAFDTGPGNALINDWMTRHDREPLDRDGAEAAKGQVDDRLLRGNATGAFLERKPPKSLDRNEFAMVLDRMTELSLPDGAATLTALTAECVVEALKHMPSPPSRWLVCGGGRKNPVMMRMMADRLNAPVDPVEAVGLDGDMLEAQAFAYLAVRSLRGLPLSAPGTTNCRKPVTGGRLATP